MCAVLAVPILALNTSSLAYFWNDIKRVAAALNVAPVGERLVKHIQKRFTDIADRVKTIPERPTVACIEWIDPLMVAGNWVPEMVQLAGGTPMFGQVGKHSGWISWEELVKENPEFIVVMAYGFDIAKTRREMSVLSRREEWRRLDAVLNNRVFLTDGNRYFNRPGPRLAESLEILAEVLHSNDFEFDHKMSGWQYY